MPHATDRANKTGLASYQGLGTIIVVIGHPEKGIFDGAVVQKLCRSRFKIKWEVVMLRCSAVRRGVRTAWLPGGR